MQALCALAAESWPEGCGNVNASLHCPQRSLSAVTFQSSGMLSCEVTACQS